MPTTTLRVPSVFKVQLSEYSCFLSQKLRFVAKEAIIHWKMQKSDNHHYEGLAKSGDKSHDSLIILLYVWLHNKKQIYKSGNSHFWRLKPSKITSFSKKLFLISLYGKISQEQNAVVHTYVQQHLGSFGSSLPNNKFNPKFLVWHRPF